MKVLLILIDGMRSDAMSACGSSLPEELKIHSHYTMNGRTVYPSVTLPCHMSLFHSVQPARHGILTNTYVPQVRPVDGICEVLRRAEKTASMFYTWEELKDLTRPDSMARTSFVSAHLTDRIKATEMIVKDACSYLTEEQPDFCFLYLGYVDDIGHDYGWMSPEYLEAVKISLAWAKKAMEAAGLEYLTILTADHGGHDRTHGDDVPTDMTIPVFLMHPSFESRELEEASILDIAPTIASVLGVKPPREWEGKDLFH